jgi:N-acetylglucosamine kinase-like BadF-type ATPase
VSAPLFLGIDGGGTHTRVFITDSAGETAVWAGAGLSNPNHASPAELRANIQRPIAGAFAQLRASPTACRSAFLGMAGVTTAAGRASLQNTLAECGLKHAALGVDHDIRIALAGGLALRPGIALIVGTGSSCYGRAADGRSWQSGGWEALISDEGSVCFVVREAIAAAARMADGRRRETPLRAAVFEWLGIREIVDILPRIHEQGLTRSEMAALAPRVVALAEARDAAALDILDQGAFLLAEMVAGNHRKLPTGPGPDVVVTGGLGTAKSVYREKIVAAVLEQLPAATIHQPILAPAIGAALLAMQQVGQPVTADLLKRMERFNL